MSVGMAQSFIRQSKYIWYVEADGIIGIGKSLGEARFVS